MCCGLNRDTAIKQGQIAHLDQDRANNDVANLAFLCLAHHDQYDSKTSQSKGITLGEAHRFRKELHEAIERLWREPVRFGELELRSTDPIEGHFTRDGEFESAEIDVTRLMNGRLKIEGFALWGKTRQYGPNIGELELEVAVDDGVAIYLENGPEPGDEYRVAFRFEAGRLSVSEEGYLGRHGMNVTFGGEYEKAT